MEQNIQLIRCMDHKDSVYRPLPPGLKPLKEICYSKMTQMIIYSCTNVINAIYNGYKNRIIMRQFLSQLPGTVRENLLEKLSRKYIAGNYPFQLYLNEVLFSTGMRKLQLSLTFYLHQIHFENFFNLASAEGKGLRTFMFDYRNCNSSQVHVTPEIHQKIRDTLASADHLVDLRLSLIGDNVMKLIGENCTCLQNLEVLPSSITWKGFHNLTQNFVKHPAETDEENRIWESKFWGVPGLFPPLEELLPEGEPVTFYERKKSPLCSTLRSLKTDYFYKSMFEPMLALTELIPSLESISPCAWFLNYLFKMWYKPKKTNLDFAPSPLNLTSIEVDTMGESVFDMIITMCPKLRHISYSDFQPNTPSTFSLSSFNHFRCIESVHISHRTSILEAEGFCDLSAEIRERLTEMSIVNPHAPKPFDISGVDQCSALRRLKLRFHTILWSATSNGGLISHHDTMQNLSSVNLEAKVTGKAVVSLLECAPNLEHLTVSDIVERKDFSFCFLSRLLGMREMPKLETFEVHDGFLLDTEDELRSFVNHFTKIQHVGKIRFLSN